MHSNNLVKCFKIGRKKIIAAKFKKIENIFGVIYIMFFFFQESLNSLQDVSFNAEHVFVASIGSNQQSIGTCVFVLKNSKTKIKC